MKHLIQFVQRLGKSMKRRTERGEDSSPSGSRRIGADLTEALERLGQFLMGLSAVSGALSGSSGKAAGEMIGALQQLPGGRCRMVQMYVMHLAGGGQG